MIVFIIKYNLYRKTKNFKLDLFLKNYYLFLKGSPYLQQKPLQICPVKFKQISPRGFIVGSLPIIGTHECCRLHVNSQLEVVEDSIG